MKQKTYTKGEYINGFVYLGDVNPNNKPREAEFSCHCGNNFIARINNIKTGKYVSCGCVKKQRIGAQNKSHGLSTLGNKKRQEYSAYHTMIARCYRKTDYHYKWYGARGITVCERWLESFANFIEDMGFKPSKDLSLDRIDNDKGYSKENCKWATHKEQCNNRRSNKKHEAVGDTQKELSIG